MRASQTENALLPGGAELFSAVAKALNESGDRRRKEFKAQTFKQLMKFLNKHPDFPGAADLIKRGLADDEENGDETGRGQGAGESWGFGTGTGVGAGEATE